MNPKLVAIAGPWKGAFFLLSEGTHVVGREPDSQIRLDESAVSRRHCEIVRAGSRCTVRDLGSRNCTFVNGKAVTETEIALGDEVEIGASTFLLTASETVELRPEDSVYLSAAQSGATLTSSPRTTADLRALLRVSTMLHSIRGLHDARGQPARDALARLLLDLLFELFPAASGAVLLDEGDGGHPFSLVLRRQSAAPLSVSRSVVSRVVERRAVLWTGDGPDEDLLDARSLESQDVSSVLAAPLVVRGEVAAVIYLQTTGPGQRFDENHMQCLGAIAGMAAVAWENASYVEWLQAANDQLLEEMKLKHEMVGSSAKMVELQRVIAKAAPSSSTILILGESGTGKELVARAIHRNSPRSGGALRRHQLRRAQPKRCSRANCSATRKAPSPERWRRRKASSKSLRAGRCSWTKSARWRRRCRPNYCACCRSGRSSAWAEPRPIKLDIRLVAATNRDLAEEVRKEDVSTGSLLPAERGERREPAVAGASPRTSFLWRIILPGASRSGAYGPSPAFPRPPELTCRVTPGLAMCASWRTPWSAPWCSGRAT